MPERFVVVGDEDSLYVRDDMTKPCEHLVEHLLFGRLLAARIDSEMVMLFVIRSGRETRNGRGFDFFGSDEPASIDAEVG